MSSLRFLTSCQPNGLHLCMERGLSRTWEVYWIKPLFKKVQLHIWLILLDNVTELFNQTWGLRIFLRYALSNYFSLIRRLKCNSADSTTILQNHYNLDQARILTVLEEPDKWSIILSFLVTELVKNSSVVTNFSTDL